MSSCQSLDKRTGHRDRPFSLTLPGELVVREVEYPQVREPAEHRRDATLQPVAPQAQPLQPRRLHTTPRPAQAQATRQEQGPEQ
jgi:hypothetical protein